RAGLVRLLKHLDPHPMGKLSRNEDTFPISSGIRPELALRVFLKQGASCFETSYLYAHAHNTFASLSEERCRFARFTFRLKQHDSAPSGVNLTPRRAKRRKLSPFTGIQSRQRESFCRRFKVSHNYPDRGDSFGGIS